MAAVRLPLQGVFVTKVDLGMSENIVPYDYRVRSHAVTLPFVNSTCLLICETKSISVP